MWRPTHWLIQGQLRGISHSSTRRTEDELVVELEHASSAYRTVVRSFYTSRQFTLSQFPKEAHSPGFGGHPSGPSTHFLQTLLPPSTTSLAAGPLHPCFTPAPLALAPPSAFPALALASFTSLTALARPLSSFFGFPSGPIHSAEGKSSIHVRSSRGLALVRGESSGEPGRTVMAL